MPEEQPEPKKGASLYRAVFIAAGLYALILSFHVLAPIILSLLLILIISMALNPLVYKLRQWLGGRRVATALILGCFFGVAGLTAWGFYGPVKRATVDLAERLPEYWERIQRPLIKMEQRAAVKEERVKREVSEEIAEEEIRERGIAPPRRESDEETAVQERQFLYEALSQVLSGIAAGFSSIAVNMATLFVILVTVFMGVIFMLANPHRVIGLFLALAPERHHDRMVVVIQRISYVITRWALAMLLGMAAVGVLVFLAMWPVFGFEDALVLGLIAAVLEIVPYLGPILAALPALLLALSEGGWVPLVVLVLYAIIQLIENNVVSPVIVGGRLHLHPLAVIFSVLICVAIFGVVAVLIAIPMVAVLGILYEEFYRPRFLPNVSSDDIIAQSRLALREKPKPRNPEGEEREGGTAGKPRPA